MDGKGKTTEQAASGLLTLPARVTAGEQTESQLYRAEADRQQALEALQNSERHFRTLIDNSADAIALLAADGIVLSVSRAVKRILGYESHEFVGRNGLEFIPPDHLQHVTETLQEVVQRPGKTMTVEHTCRHKDGSLRWVESTVTNLVFDPSVTGARLQRS
jgi:PAS domain S-box-containing protein